ncbi:MAG: hypothetical protein Q8O26_10940 [Phreatobacter sp.]|uniref:hypothetical protein n=1 Tax=Phreatobacter sp. TaxID=1966341 RepID=UPI0027327156|nr:hypothetical protein [Phreatobacter sp.]MDP2802390.1 hypothetical protein [Phreatobacter sp.]
MSLIRATTAALVLAAGFAASAQASGPGQSPAQSMGTRAITYCGACLCTAVPPAMTTAGDWVPNGQLLGGSQVFKFRPAGQPVSAPTVCNR